MIVSVLSLQVNSNTPPSAIAGGASFLGGAAVASATANAVPSLQASATTPSTAHTSSASTNAGSGSGDIDTHFVENLLRIYSHGRQIVQNVFDSNASFDEAHKNGMASFINKCVKKPFSSESRSPRSELL
jgi:hypothetical protein